MGNFSLAQQLHNKIQKLINSSRYNEAFLLLKNQMHQYDKLRKELDKLKDVESNYRYMLDYVAEGHVDNSRQDMIEQIRDTLSYANDMLLRERALIDSSDTYSSIRRMFNLKNTTLHSLIDEYNSSADYTPWLLDDLFNYVWTMFGSDISEFDQLSVLLDNSSTPEFIKALLISAITLGNLSYFDPESFEILINQYETSDSIIVKARAITGIILIGLLKSTRLSGNLKLRSRLILSADDENLKKLLNEVLINIIRTYDTKRIDNKMRNEVIPGLMKIKPEIIDKLKNLTSESENFLSDANPQWEEIIENSEIGNKLKEINDLQLEGADVMVTAFSNLKGFPFFYQVSNWFMPFNPDNPEFASLPIENDDKTVSQLTTVMCDSDLHSFLLSIKSMPEERRNQMLLNIRNQMKEAYEAMSNSIGETDSQKLSKKIRHTLQDLYRFFNFYRKKGEFNNPFDNPFINSHFEPLVSILGIEKDSLKLIAEFYFKNKYYREAAGFFELIDRMEPGNFNIWEKIGFCYDRMQQYQEAVEWYLKAELVNPDNQWLEKKIAIALKNAGNPQEALVFYEKALIKEAENYHLLMSAGQSYLAVNDFKGALKHFYHANYLKPEKLDALRAIAWTELISGNNEKAGSLYKKIISDYKTDKVDFLNAAHCALTSGDFKAALNLYKTFIEKNDNKDITELVIAFKEDAEALKKLGIKTADLRLIIDKIRYDLIS